MQRRPQSGQPSGCFLQATSRCQAELVWYHFIPSFSQVLIAALLSFHFLHRGGAVVDDPVLAPPVDVIICSECIYTVTSVESLLHTMHLLSNATTEIWVCSVSFKRNAPQGASLFPLTLKVAYQHRNPNVERIFQEKIMEAFTVVNACVPHFLMGCSNPPDPTTHRRPVFLIDPGMVIFVSAFCCCV